VKQTFNAPDGDFTITFEDDGKKHEIAGTASIVEISQEPIYDEVFSMYDMYAPVSYATENRITMTMQVTPPFTITTHDLSNLDDAVVTTYDRVEESPVKVGRNYAR
jgi:hypothetical protein